MPLSLPYLLLVIGLVAIGMVGAIALVKAQRAQRDQKNLRRLLQEQERAAAEQSRMLAALRMEWQAKATATSAQMEQLAQRCKSSGDLNYARGEHLRYEQSKLTYLPLHHPERIRLTQLLDRRMKPIREQLERVLFPHHEPLSELDWMYKLKTKKFPYSLTDEEGMILFKLVADQKFTEGYEIATAFGFSSFFLGLAFQQNGGRLVSVDAYIEESQEDYLYDPALARAHAEQLQRLMLAGSNEELPAGLRFALNGAKTLGIDGCTSYRVGFSPDGVPALLQGRTLDFAFIDGGHFGDQPLRDVEAVAPFLHPERFLLVFHDTHCDAVARGVHHAAQLTGGRIDSIHTRNRLATVSRGIPPAAMQACRELVSRQPG